MMRTMRYNRRDQRQLDEEEEIWFNEDDDFADVPQTKTEIDSYNVIKSKIYWHIINAD